MSSQTSNIPNYPDPALQYPEFDLNQLPDPPVRYRLYGEIPEDINKIHRLGRQELDALVKFHCWGIKLGVRRPTSVRIIRGLMKLVYYMDDVHRPRSWEELCDTTRDAGPRLLSCSIDSTSLIPISRHHPQPPSPDARTKPGYSRPPYAASCIPDSYIERMLQVGSGESSIDLTGSTVLDDNVISLDDSHDAGNFNHQQDIPFDTIMASPMLNFTNTTPAGSLIRLPNVQAHDVIEAIERTILQFAYTCLERHPSAAPRAPRPHITATTEEDLLKSIVSSVPAVSKVSISDTTWNGGMKLDKYGNQFIYRGRGPVWRANSCAVDCAIVSGRLLDAGSTMYDRKDAGWENRLSRAERAFIDVTDANWDVLSKENSIELRDQFWRVLEESSPAIRVGRFNSMWSVWAAVTPNIPQFEFSYVEALGYCPCRKQQPSTATYNASFVTPPVYPQDQYGVTAQEVISRPFTSVQLSNCRECGMTETVTRERRITNLPLRMVVTLDRRVFVKNHTQDISFDYCDINGQPQRATYRWLGGIYSHNNHFRVFWTDNKRGEASSGELMAYDGMQNSGLMFGGISPYHPEERVHPMWWRGRSIPLLIYERVMDPDPEVLNCALHSVFGMMNSQLANVPILQQHTPWIQTSVPAEAPARVWNSTLPAYSNRFYTTPTAYTPQQSIEQDTVISQGHQQHQPIDLTQLPPRMDTPQPFTVDPMATLNSGSPIKIPISLPITQRLNQSNSAFLSGADPDVMMTSSPSGPSSRLSPQGPFYWVSSPSPPRAMPESPNTWMRQVTNLCSRQDPSQPRVVHLKRVIEEVDQDGYGKERPNKSRMLRIEDKKGQSGKKKASKSTR